MSKPAADPALAVPQQDLIAHHRPIQAELEQAACRVIASGRYIQGPEVEALETEVARAAGVGHAIGLSSGTDALLVLLMALELRPGDEVVTTPFTFFATAGAVARLGGRPVFADVDPDTLNLDPARAAAALGPRTRAVITVDLFGGWPAPTAWRRPAPPGACRSSRTPRSPSAPAPVSTARGWGSGRWRPRCRSSRPRTWAPWATPACC